MVIVQLYQGPGRCPGDAMTMLQFLASLLSVLFFLGYTEARGAKPQPQPESYNKTTPISRPNFEVFEKSNLHLNSFIPSAPSNGLRVVTYNVHYFKDLHAKVSNVQNVLADVRAMDAGVIIFQEVLTSTWDSDRKAFDAGLNSLGYKYLYFDNSSSCFLGNMIASRYPLQNLTSLDLGAARVLVEAEVPLQNGDKLTVFGTHWEVGNPATRLGQSKKIIDHINSKGGKAMGKFLLGADFNAHYMSPPIQNLLKSGLMRNSFNILNWPHPNYTCWAGHAIDFIFAGNDLTKNVIGSYVYHTLSSDHLPIIIDLDVMPDSTAVSHASSSASGSGSSYLIIGAVVLVIIAAGAALYFFMKRRNASSDSI